MNISGKISIFAKKIGEFTFFNSSISKKVDGKYRHWPIKIVLLDKSKMNPDDLKEGNRYLTDVKSGFISFDDRFSVNDIVNERLNPMTMVLVIQEFDIVDVFPIKKSAISHNLGGISKNEARKKGN